MTPPPPERLARYLRVSLRIIFPRFAAPVLTPSAAIETASPFCCDSPPDRRAVGGPVWYLGPPDVFAFLHDREHERGNRATRNVRLAAIHAFFRFGAADASRPLEQCQRVLAIPFKRSPRVIEYLEYPESKPC